MIIKENDIRSIDLFLSKLKINKAIIDFDGVIVNSEPIHRKSYLYVLEKIGVDTTNFDFSNYIGNNEKTIWSRIIHDFSINESIQDLFEIRKDYINKLVLKQAPSWFIKSILIFYIKKRGAILVSSGNGNTIDMYLKKWGLDQYFSRKIMSYDYNHPIDKSNILKSCIKELNGNVVIIEDSSTYSLESKENEAKVIWVMHSLNLGNLKKIMKKNIDLIIEQ